MNVDVHNRTDEALTKQHHTFETNRSVSANILVYSPHINDVLDENPRRNV